MQIGEAVRKVSDIVGTGFEAKKIEGLVRELDMRAQIDLHGIRAGEAVCGEELVIPEPYDRAYIYFASARVHFEREEYEIYNNNYERFEELYSAYARWYRRTNGYAGKGERRIRGLW